MRVAHLCLAGLSLVAVGSSALAQVPINELGTAVSETFDGLASTGTTGTALPSGWAFVEVGSGAVDATYGVGTGSSTTGNTYSFGAAPNLADRAFGTLQSNTLAPTIGAHFTNATGGTIESLTIGYTGEIWRVGQANAIDQLDFQYSTDATSLTTGTWVDVNALDFSTEFCVTAGNCGATGSGQGNATNFRRAVQGTISGLSIPAGATFWIRFSDLNVAGADDGLAIDDFSITAAGSDSDLPFVLRRSLAVAGSYAVVGNVLLDCALSPCPLGNNGTPFVLVDADNDPSTAGSSAATLDLPDDATPRAAYLLVTVNGSAETGPGPNWVSELTTTNVSAKLKAPGETSYTTLTPFRVSLDDSGTAYQGLYDVTAHVAGDGQYWVADPTIYPDSATYNGVGNWILIVVYDQPNAPLRLVNIYDGVQACFRSSFVVPVSGFETPSVGPVTGTLTTVGGDGAAGVGGDTVTLNSLAVSNSANPANNIGNNTVSGVDGLPFPRVPATFAATDELVDIDTFDISGAFTNNATSGTVTFTCGDDGVVWHGLVLAFDIDAPVLDVQKSVSVVGGGAAVPGAQLAYVVTVANLAASPENARLVQLTDVLPDGVTPSGTSFTVQAAATPTTITFADDGDAGELVDGTLTLDIGALAIGETRTIRFTVTIDSGFVGPIDNEATVAYRGVSSNAPILAASNVASVQVGGQSGDALALVFFDEDGNDTADLGELGLDGWQLTLGGVTATTDVDGLADFSDVPVGEQAFTIVPGPTPDPDATWVFDPVGSVTVTAGETTIIEVPVTCVCDDGDPCTVDSCTLGFCEFEPIEGECGGAALVVVAFDEDGDGEADFEEPGLSGWTVSIGATDRTTDEVGFAVFDALAPGTFPFIVTPAPPEDPRATWVFTTEPTITIINGELVLREVAVTCACDDDDPCTEDRCYLGQCEFVSPEGPNGLPDDTCNGVDDDCNGETDDAWQPTPTTCGLGVCANQGVTTCVDGVPGDSCVALAANGPDTNCDTVDDDCDGTADEDFRETITCGEGACENNGIVTCVAGVEVPSCVVRPATGTDDDCDGIDDDCDGATDEAFVPTAASCGVGVCAARNGIQTCVAGQVQSSCVEGQPTGADTDCNGLDDDCDGTTDEGFVAGPMACGVGECGGTGTATCIGGTVQNVGCVLVGDGTACESAGPCAQAATCQAGVCTATVIKSCADDNPCTTDSCDPQLGCVFRVLQNGSECDDDNRCTAASTCTDGICAGDPLNCAAPDLCEGLGECNPATGVCDYPVIPGCDPCPAADTTPPTITCPAAVEVECEDRNGTEAVLGAASARDACGAVTVDDDAPGVYPRGTTTVTFTARDADGNSATCTTTVTVEDTTPPVIFCPESNEVRGDPGTCGALVTHVPSATDTCGDVRVIGPAADTFYPPGPSDASYVVVDDAGNRTTCDTTIDVTGLAGLDVVCEPALTVDAPADFCGWPEAIGATVVDLCRSTADVTSDSDFFPVGTSTVTFTATRDTLSDTCETLLTVNDVTPPTVTCGVPPVDADLLDLVAVFTSSAADACTATLAITDAHCLVAGAAVSERCEVSVEGNTVTVEDAPAGPAGQRVEIVWTATATDPSGNTSGAIQCRVGVDPTSLDHDLDGVPDRDDNCPDTFNDQRDQDGDLIGDACDDEDFTGFEALGGGGCAAGGEAGLLALALATFGVALRRRSSSR